MCTCVRATNKGAKGYHQAYVYFTDPIHLVVHCVTISNDDGTNNPFHTTSHHSKQDTCITFASLWPPKFEYIQKRICLPCRRRTWAGTDNIVLSLHQFVVAEYHNALFNSPSVATLTFSQIIYKKNLRASHHLFVVYFIMTCTRDTINQLMFIFFTDGFIQIGSLVHI